MSPLLTKRVSIYGVWQGRKLIDIEENHEIHDLLFPSKPQALHLKYIFIKILLIYTMI